MELRGTSDDVAPALSAQIRRRSTILQRLRRAVIRLRVPHLLELQDEGKLSAQEMPSSLLIKSELRWIDLP